MLDMAKLLADYGLVGVLVLSLISLAWITRGFIGYLIRQEEGSRNERIMWLEVIKKHMQRDLEAHQEVISVLQRLVILVDERTRKD